MVDEADRIEPTLSAPKGDAAPEFGHWAQVEIMGHRRVYGRVSEEAIAGAKFLRIDLPEEAGTDKPQFYGSSAIFSILPCDEDEVRDHWRRLQDMRGRRTQAYLPTVDADPDFAAEGDEPFGYFDDEDADEDAGVDL